MGARRKLRPKLQKRKLSKECGAWGPDLAMPVLSTKVSHLGVAADPSLSRPGGRKPAEHIGSGVVAGRLIWHWAPGVAQHGLVVRGKSVQTAEPPVATAEAVTALQRLGRH